MMQLPLLPTIDAALNLLALILLIIGYYRIRCGHRQSHRRFMIAAFIVSILFLAVYVTHHVTAEEKKFTGQGLIRPVYFFILLTHIVLAATVPLLALRTIYLAAQGRLDSHRKIARVTFPIWVYVSITGIAVYVMLFLLEPLFPAGT